MMGARILLTGGSGMIGAHLARRLVAGGHRVAVLARRAETPPRLADLAGRLEILAADLTDRAAVRAAVARAAPEAVFHLASTPFNPPPTSTRHLDVNVLGTDHLLDALAAAAPRARVVYTGSAAQYGSGDGLRETDPERPATLLGASKTAAAALLHAYGRLHGLVTVEVRLFTPYGPWERPGRLIPGTILSALRGEAVRIGHGGQERDYLYIDDVVDALVRTLEAPLAAGTVINVCSGEGVSVRTVAERVLALMGDPVPLAVGALPTRADEIWKLSGDPAAARRLLGWAPRTGLDGGLRATIDWVRSHRTLAESLT